jgi:hypothetical protein
MQTEASRNAPVAHRARQARLPIVALLAAALPGCSPSAKAPPPAEPTAPVAPAPVEAWYVCSIDGSRVGYEHVKTTEVTRAGRRLLEVEIFSHMKVKRFGETTDQQLRFTSLETPDGQLLEFEGELAQGPAPMKLAGRVEGDALRVEVRTLGKTLTDTIPWSEQYGGFRAVEQSLARDPMRPGQRRTIRSLVPGFNVVGTTELAAADFEPVATPAGTYELLRIDTTTTLPEGEPFRGVLWVDRTGEVVKNRLEAMHVESFRATRAQALEQAGPPEFDLGLDVAVRVDRALESPHATTRVRYRARLEGGDPARVFVSGGAQRVESVDSQTAELTVWAVRPDGDRPDDLAPDPPPTEADRRPSSLIQSDDPAIVAEARKTAPGESDPWLVAVALERRVGELLEVSDYSQAFATAAEAIDSGKGDCTEHAVLLAALARAREIPARVAVGLVYKGQSFYYHMWTEVYVAGRWIPLDATLGRGGIGAAHLKMGHGSLADLSALTTFLPVLQAIGRLQIEILEVE